MESARATSLSVACERGSEPVRDFPATRLCSSAAAMRSGRCSSKGGIPVFKLPSLSEVAGGFRLGDAKVVVNLDRPRHLARPVKGSFWLPSGIAAGAPNIEVASPRGFAGHITRPRLACEGWLAAAQMSRR